MINQSAAIFLIVLAIWYTMQPSEIFSCLGKFLKRTLPKAIHPPVFECNVCMTPYYGSAVYWLIPWHHDLLWWAPVVIMAMGFQVALNKLSPPKPKKDDKFTTKSKTQKNESNTIKGS